MWVCVALYYSEGTWCGEYGGEGAQIITIYERRCVPEKMHVDGMSPCCSVAVLGTLLDYALLQLTECAQILECGDGTGRCRR